MNEYYYYNKSSFRVLTELFDLLKFGRLRSDEICERFEITTRQFRKDIACLKAILFDYFEYDVELYYVFSRREFQIVYNKGTANYLFLPFKF